MRELLNWTVVASRRGRDCGRFYVVLGVDVNAERVILANGESRTLARPKLKNISHIMPTKTVLPLEGANDLQIKTALKAYEDSLNLHEDKSGG